MALSLLSPPDALLVVPVTIAQAGLLARAMQARDAAHHTLALTLAAMTAGTVPEGAELCQIDTATGDLTFKVSAAHAG